MPAVGCLLIVAGIVLAPLVAGKLASVDRPSLALALVVDGLRLGVFVGLALLLIGLLRNRRIARAAKEAEAPGATTTDGDAS